MWLNHLLVAVARFGPIFLQERNFCQVEPRVPKFGINSQRFVQSGFGFVVNTLPHQNNSAEVLRLSEIRLTRIDGIKLFKRF